MVDCDHSRRYFPYCMASTFMTKTNKFSIRDVYMIIDCNAILSLDNIDHVSCTAAQSRCLRNKDR